MKHKTLLLTAILAMSIVTIFTACPEPQEAEKKPIKPVTCDGKPWEPKQWCVTTLASESLDGPYGIALAKDGTLYVTEFNGNKIKKLTLKEDGTLKAVSTIAGDGTAAQFNKPIGITIAKDALYVVDANRIRRIALASPHEVSTIVTKLAPNGIAVVKDGLSLYVTHGIRDIKLITLSDNIVKPITNAMKSPEGIAIAKDNSSLYVTNTGDNSIKRIALTSPYKVSTIAKSGFSLPKGITLAPDGTLYVADTGNHLIKQLTPKEDGTFEDPIIIAGEDGTKGTDNGIGTTAQFNLPTGIAVVSDTLLYVVDAGNGSIRKLEYKEAE